MGEFATTNVTVRVAAPKLAIARGNFEHIFADETVLGNFTQVWQKFDEEGWKIVHEHTARAQVVATGQAQRGRNHPAGVTSR
jgi:hypothetical protein